MTKRAMLRDMNKARIGFEGSVVISSGHWGCGAYGNNHDLMFLKQWLAASEAGAKTLEIHEFSKNQSHHIVPLIRKLRHLTVGQLWVFLLEITADLVPCKMGEFYKRVCNISLGKMKVPGAGIKKTSDAKITQGKVACVRTMGEGESKEPADTQTNTVLNSEENPDVEPTVVFPFDEMTKGQIPDGVDPKRKEDFLSNADFEKYLGMARNAFVKLPKWRQQKLKKNVGLF